METQLAKQGHDGTTVRYAYRAKDGEGTLALDTTTGAVAELDARKHEPAFARAAARVQRFWRDGRYPERAFFTSSK